MKIKKVAIIGTGVIGACKEIGIIKDEIKNAILDGEIENNYKSAFNLMKIKGKSLGL